MSAWLTQISLLSWAFYGSLTAIAVVGLLLLLVSDRRTARAWTLPVAVGVAALVVTVGAFLVDFVIRPFPEFVPRVVLTWSAVAALGVALGSLRVIWATGWRRKLAFGLAGLVVLAWGAAGVNREYGYLPTVGALLGTRPANTMMLPAHPPPESDTDLPRRGLPLEESWQAPADVPAAGRVIEDVPIPATLSHFPARPAWVYLPPAYLVPDPPRLPVLVLIAGQPGAPRNWIDGGYLVDTMDRFASRHHGLAPIVVMPDALGQPMANPLCMDSRLGQAETYLARDVPQWIRQKLAPDPDPAGWAIGGFSYGGTCGLQLALRAPDVYRLFLDIGGQLEPTLGTRSLTVDRAFGGDEEAFRRVNPLDEMATRSFPDAAGYFVVGAQDTSVKRQLRTLDEAAVRCGMDTQWLEIEGVHSWQVAAEGLRRTLPWIAGRMWITRR